MNVLQTNLDLIKLEKDTKILPENIKKNVTIFGVVGTLDSGSDTSDATATASDILESKTAYAGGQKLTGTLSDFSNKSDRDYSSISSIGKSDALKKVQLVLNEKATLLKASDATIAVKNEATLNLDISYDSLIELLGIDASIIKEGETILGVTGTYQGVVDPEEYDKTDEVLRTIIGED